MKNRGRDVVDFFAADRVLHSSTNVCICPSVSSKQSVPKEVNHCEVASCIRVMDEVELMFRLNQAKRWRLEPSAWYCLPKSTCAQNDAALTSAITRNSSNGSTKYNPPRIRTVGMRKGVVVPFGAAIGRRYKMPGGIVGMVEFDVIMVEGPTQPPLTKPTMHNRLAARHHRMRAYRSQNEHTLNHIFCGPCRTQCCAWN
jgi:hypothetical protein